MSPVDPPTVQESEIFPIAEIPDHATIKNGMNESEMEAPTLDVQRDITFRVTVPSELSDDQLVAVTGNHPSLGDWDPSKMLILRNQSVPGGRKEWLGTVSIPLSHEVRYRYVICELSDESRKVSVHRWETNLVPRVVLPGKTVETTEIFGFCEALGGRLTVQNGWLIHETLVQLKIYNNPINLWRRKHLSKLSAIKVTALDLHHRQRELETEDDLTDESNLLPPPDLPAIEVAAMKSGECKFEPQSQYGKIYKPDDFLIYQTRVPDFSKVAFTLDLYLYDPDHLDKAPQHIGTGFMLPSVFHESIGTTVIPISGLKHIPVGQIRIDYLVIHPASNLKCDLSVSYARYWNTKRGTVEVGHRGAGNAFLANKKTQPVQLMENSIASLKHAALNGADYVEFDVQLSKDLIPVLFHDFFVSIATTKKYKENESDLVDIPLKDLTLEQLQGLKIHHAKHRSDLSDVIYRTTHFSEEDHYPFPTLKYALEQVDSKVGFNVEIKWDMITKDGAHESSNPFECNMYVDTILRCIFDNARDRRIVISCFHPDICTMVRQKQNLYPVLFLTQGQTKRWQPYMDPRTNTSPMAVNFAHASGILGIDVYTEDILNDYSLVWQCRKEDLVLFCWGEDNNDPATVSLLKSLGVHGIIHDRMDERLHGQGRDSIFLAVAPEMRETLLADSVDLATGSDTTTSDTSSIHSEESQ